MYTCVVVKVVSCYRADCGKVACVRDSTVTTVQLFSQKGALEPVQGHNQECMNNEIMS